MKKYSISFILIFFVGLFVFNNASAVEIMIDSKTGASVVTSEINLERPSIITQKVNDFNIVFHITNKEGVLSGVKYGVKLFKDTKEGQFMVDEYIYPESVVVPANSDITKDIIYKAPSNIDGGIYSLYIFIKNSNSRPLGLLFVKKINITQTTKFIQVIPETCFLTVEGEKIPKEYTLLQGIDITPDENIKLNCTVMNSTEAEVSATPVYETHYRNTAGEIVKQTGGDTNPIVFAPNEKKVISLTLPKATEPQAYDVIVSLKSGTSVSNSSVVHYVIKGVSATIQNLVLDKESYKKGEMAKVSFIWSASADNFPGSRLKSTVTPTINLDMKIKDGWRNCIEPVSQALVETENIVKLESPVKMDCDNFTATISLKDDAGKILAEKEISFSAEEKKFDFSLIEILIAIGVLVVAGVAVYFVNLKTKKNENEIPNIQ